MAVFVGVDIGSTASKAAVLIDGEPAAMVVGPSTTNPTRTAQEIYHQALEESGIAPSDVAFIVGTGYGRTKVEFAGQNVSEITCHGRGSHFLLPSARTIIDIGGQDTKVISVDADGNLLDFVMNDKCAAGTGRFLEAMARSMEIGIADIGGYYDPSADCATITSMCSVFAESEVINLVNDGTPVPAIINGLMESLAGRVASLATRLGVTDAVVMSGGVAKNPGVREAVARKLKIQMHDFNGADPQMVGALGAALVAADLGG